MLDQEGTRVFAQSFKKALYVSAIAAMIIIPVSLYIIYPPKVEEFDGLLSSLYVNNKPYHHEHCDAYSTTGHIDSDGNYHSQTTCTHYYGEDHNDYTIHFQLMGDVKKGYKNGTVLGEWDFHAGEQQRLWSIGSAIHLKTVNGVVDTLIVNGVKQ